MNKKKLEEALKKISDASEKFIPQKCGGVISKKCRQCGGNIVTKGKGVLFETCSICGKEYHEPVYRS